MSPLIGKSCIAAGRASVPLHTMTVLKGSQLKVLKEMEDDDYLSPEAIKSLCDTKHTAHAIGLSMVGLD